MLLASGVCLEDIKLLKGMQSIQTVTFDIVHGMLNFRVEGQGFNNYVGLRYCTL